LRDPVGPTDRGADCRTAGRSSSKRARFCSQGKRPSPGVPTRSAARPGEARAPRLLSTASLYGSLDGDHLPPPHRSQQRQTGPGLLGDGGAPPQRASRRTRRRARVSRGQRSGRGHRGCTRHGGQHGRGTLGGGRAPRPGDVRERAARRDRERAASVPRRGVPARHHGGPPLRAGAGTATRLLPDRAVPLVARHPRPRPAAPLHDAEPDEPGGGRGVVRRAARAAPGRIARGDRPRPGRGQERDDTRASR